MTAERRQLIEKARQSGASVLATLVRVEGSSYRRVGARLLLGEDGSYAGTISGGCLEVDLVRRAKWLIRNGPWVQHYSTSIDDTAEIPFGLGCGGELDLLLEGANSEEVKALFAGVERSLAGVSQRVVTWLPGIGGESLRRAVFSAEEGAVLFASAELTAAELDHVRRLAPGEGWPKVFVEELLPPQRLVVFGAGDDARPMVAMAATLGWSVVVADGRRSLARADRFPGAERVVVLGDEEVPVRAADAVVLMTHSYEQDRALLARMLPVRPRYLGLLGARHRSSLLVSEVSVELGWTVEQTCERLHAPVGLDLGGDGAEAIALSVIAEVQGCVQGKLGHSRRLSAEDVTMQVGRGGASAYLQAQCALGAV